MRRGLRSRHIISSVSSATSRGIDRVSTKGFVGRRVALGRCGARMDFDVGWWMERDGDGDGDGGK